MTPQKPGSWDFRQIANSVLNNSKYAITPRREVLSSAKAKFISKDFSVKANFDESAISLPVFFF